MKNLILSFLSITVIAFSASAQDCNKEMLPQTPGIWKEGMKGSTSVIGKTAEDLAHEKKILAQLKAMTKTPIGL